VSENRIRFVNVEDGRTLAFEQYGDPDGSPVFLLHGTPGCRLSGRHPDESRVVEAGLRLITYDRPGYGQSARHKGRRVVDCVADITAIRRRAPRARGWRSAPAASDAGGVRRGRCAV
jgi:pimeloyl-ACP methyl ester carboxylesterase